MQFRTVLELVRGAEETISDKTRLKGTGQLVPFFFVTFSQFSCVYSLKKRLERSHVFGIFGYNKFVQMLFYYLCALFFT